MPQYLAIAESVYRKVKDVELFSDDTIENLNNLMIFRGGPTCLNN